MLFKKWKKGKQTNEAFFLISNYFTKKKKQTTTQIDERKWIIKNKQINNNKFKKKRDVLFITTPCENLNVFFKLTWKQFTDHVSLSKCLVEIK